MSNLTNLDIVHTIAGTFIIISTILGYYVSVYWFLLTLFVGINLFQFGITKWCPLEKILQKIRN